MQGEGDEESFGDRTWENGAGKFLGGIRKYFIKGAGGVRQRRFFSLRQWIIYHAGGYLIRRAEAIGSVSGKEPCR